MHAGLDKPAHSQAEILRHRRLASAVESDWRNRMVFYDGDERAFYQGLDDETCDPLEAIFDPSCRTARKTHAEVAYNGDADSGADCAAGGACGYGVYRTAACRGWVQPSQWRHSAVVPQRSGATAHGSGQAPRSRAWLGSAGPIAAPSAVPVCTPYPYP